METVRYFSTRSSNYTNTHNAHMDNLLWGLVVWGNHSEVASLKDGSVPAVRYDNQYDLYYATNDEGLELLEHLRDLDLIEEVFEV